MLFQTVIHVTVTSFRRCPAVGRRIVLGIGSCRRHPRSIPRVRPVTTVYSVALVNTITLVDTVTTVDPVTRYSVVRSGIVPLDGSICVHNRQAGVNDDVICRRDCLAILTRFELCLCRGVPGRCASVVFSGRLEILNRPGMIDALGAFDTLCGNFDAQSGSFDKQSGPF